MSDIQAAVFAGGFAYIGFFIYSVQTLFWNKGLSGEEVLAHDVLVIPIRHAFKLLLSPYVILRSLNAR